MTARILIIAGSDSGGGAGIQADIKTVTMLGGHAMTAITAVTAQNTLGVQAVHPIPTEMVLAQIDSVLADIGADAVKIGMIGSAATALAVGERLAPLDIPIVFDPVMVATSGSELADGRTIAAFERLMDIATVVTPNLPELAALGGREAVLAHGCHLLEKGGHAGGGQVHDRLWSPDGASVREWTGSRIDSDNTHGTGCTLASALTCRLGQGVALAEAVGDAVGFVRAAILAAPRLGGGCGPLGQGAAAGRFPLATFFRWRIRPGREADFERGWRGVTRALRGAGSGGSALFRSEAGDYCAFARWPDRAARDRAFAMVDGGSDSELMHAAIAETVQRVDLDERDNLWRIGGAA